MDGSNLDNSERQDAARVLIQAASNKVVLGATFKFDSGDTPLTSGDNIVNIKLTFNNVRETAIAVKLINVSDQ